MENKTDEELIKILDTEFASIFKDGFTNSVLGLGTANAGETAATWQPSNLFYDPYTLRIVYESSWVFRNAISKKSAAIVGDLTIMSSDNAENEEKVKGVYENLKPALRELISSALIYGGAAGLMMIENHITESAFDRGLDIEDIEKGLKMSIYSRDRWFGLGYEGVAPTAETLGTSDFMKPEYYDFAMHAQTGTPDTETKLSAHYSYVLRAEGRQAVGLTKEYLHGWGMPELIHVFNELKRDENMRATAASIMSKSLIEVFKMSGIRNAFAALEGGNSSTNKGASTQVGSRLNAILKFRGANNISFIDREDEYAQFQYSAMTGIADMLHQQRKFTAGALETPEMILYGSADKKGLEFQGEGKSSPEVEIYQQTIDARREEIFKPVMDKLLPIIWKMATGNEMPEKTTYSFDPIFKDNKTEVANRLKTIVDVLKELREMGVYTHEMVLRELKNRSKELMIGSNIDEAYIDEIKRLTEEVENGEKEETNSSSGQPEREIRSKFRRK